ncbi:MAG TPA: protein kinase [Gammaproteobacteria bacterium]|nr:protein kinase [Gammaproteobacteria bacterium]
MRAGAPKRTPEGRPPELGISRTDHAGPGTAGTVVGRYRLERALDSKARVWLAADGAGGLHVVKIGTRDSVRAEFEMLSMLRHPNIVAVRELIESEAGSFLVLEYLSGGDLVSLAGFAPAHWLGPLADVIEALGFVHRHGIVHRDLKARNVLLDAEDRARLTDFASAQPAGSRFSRGGMTEAVIEPSRRDGPVAPADDVYALACLVHELLFGAPPGTGDPKAARASAGPLIRLVGECLATSDRGARPDLSQFEAVVKSLRRSNETANE